MYTKNLVSFCRNLTPCPITRELGAVPTRAVRVLPGWLIGWLVGYRPSYHEPQNWHDVRSEIYYHQLSVRFYVTLIFRWIPRNFTLVIRTPRILNLESWVFVRSPACEIHWLVMETSNSLRHFLFIWFPKQCYQVVTISAVLVVAMFRRARASVYRSSCCHFSMRALLWHRGQSCLC
jgi:hypothetical protein